MQDSFGFNIRFKPQANQVTEAEINLLMTIFADMIIEMNMLEAASKQDQ